MSQAHPETMKMGHWLSTTYAYFCNSCTLTVILSEAKHLVAFLGEMLRFAQHDKEAIGSQRLTHIFGVVR